MLNYMLFNLSTFINRKEVNYRQVGNSQWEIELNSPHFFPILFQIYQVRLRLDNLYRIFYTFNVVVSRDFE